MDHEGINIFNEEDFFKKLKKRVNKPGAETLIFTFDEEDGLKLLGVNPLSKKGIINMIGFFFENFQDEFKFTVAEKIRKAKEQIEMEASATIH